MKLAILDDWFDTLRGLPCFQKLEGIDVTVFTDHEPDPDKLAARLEPFDAVVLFRERSPMSAQILDQLPNLKLISQRSVFPHVDDSVEKQRVASAESCALNGARAPF